MVAGAPEWQRVGLPVSFERNDGQVAPAARFLLRAHGYTLFVCDESVVVVPTGARSALGISVAATHAPSHPTAHDALATRSNYLRGSDRARWVRDVPHFAEIRFGDILPGIDQVWRTRNGRAEFRFEVRPGADADGIGLTYDGCESLTVDDGRVVARLPHGEVVQSAPVAFQHGDEGRIPVAARYVIDGADRVRIALGAFDRTRELVIDPEIEASSYFGGSDQERANAVAVDAEGACYVTGGTYSDDLPTTPGAFQPEFVRSEEDAYVAKLTSDLSALVYATYIGGDDDDGDEEAGYAIALDAAGNAVIAGTTYSSDFPQVSPIQPGYAGGEDAFVTQLNAAGSDLLFSSYLGGSRYESIAGVAVDAAGNIYVGGSTGSTDFPLVSPYQSAHTGFGDDAFVVRIRNGVLAYSTYFGGTSNDSLNGVSVDSTSTAPDGTPIVIAGWTNSTDLPTANAHQGALAGALARSDGFVTRFAPDGSTLTYSTYLGGSESDEIRGLALDTSGAAYVTGQTYSLDYPDTFAAGEEEAKAAGGGARPDAFVTKLSAAGALSYSTLLGGDAADYGNAVAVGSDGAAWVLGGTSSSDFPVAEPVQGSLSSNPSLFVSRLSPDGAALEFSTYLGTQGSVSGASGLDVALGSDGALYITGWAGPGFPVTPGALQTELDESDYSSGFVTKFAGPGNTPPPNTIRSFILPKKLQVRVGDAVPPTKKKGGGKQPGVKLLAFFDSGPTEVDLSDPGTLTLGPRTFEIPRLTPDRKGKSFVYEGQGLHLAIRPSPLGSSKGKLTLTFDGDLGGAVDLDGPFRVNFTNDSGIDATGECVLSRGKFTFGKEAGELIAPALSIRKAKAKLPGVGRHNFKFVAGFTTEGRTPSQVPDIYVRFGDVFEQVIASDALQLKGSNFKLARSVGGISALALTYAKERIAVRGAEIDLGDVAEGPTPILLVFGQGEDVRAVFVRMVRKGTVLKY